MLYIISVLLLLHFSLLLLKSLDHLHWTRLDMSFYLCIIAIIILVISFINCHPGVLAWQALVEGAWWPRKGLLWLGKILLDNAFDVRKRTQRVFDFFGDFVFFASMLLNWPQYARKSLLSIFFPDLTSSSLFTDWEIHLFCNLCPISRSAIGSTFRTVLHTRCKAFSQDLSYILTSPHSRWYLFLTHDNIFPSLRIISFPHSR